MDDSNDTFAQFVADVAGGDAEATAKMAAYDQQQAFISEILSILDIWVSASIMAADDDNDGGATAAMTRARLILDDCDHRELQMLLMTLMAAYVSARTQLDDTTVVERFRTGVRNGGFEVFQRFLATGGKVCMHCGEDAETGYCETALREAAEEAVCTCGMCPDAEPVDLEVVVARTRVPDDASSLGYPLTGTGDGTGEQK